MTKFCNTCEFLVRKDGESFSRCMEPTVNKNNPWALAYHTSTGVDCYGERQKTGWFSICGMKGKKWQQKSELATDTQK